MVFQGYTLFPWLSVKENIMFGLRESGYDKSAAEQEARQWIDLIGLARFENSYPNQLSGGMKQRVAIARALVLQPDLIILDEPTSALDRTVQKQVIQLLRDIQSRYGLSYIFISHDLAVVRALSHKLLVLQHGKIVEYGDAADIFRSPKQRYTQELLNAALFYQTTNEPTTTTN